MHHLQNLIVELNLIPGPHYSARIIRYREGVGVNTPYKEKAKIDALAKRKRKKLLRWL